jgi:hypothetical protein
MQKGFFSVVIVIVSVIIVLLLVAMSMVKTNGYSTSDDIRLSALRVEQAYYFLDLKVTEEVTSNCNSNNFVSNVKVTDFCVSEIACDKTGNKFICYSDIACDFDKIRYNDIFIFNRDVNCQTNLIVDTDL